MFEPIPIALVLALILAVLGRLLRSRAAFATAALWLAYALYEFLMYRRVLCTGECNIRVDLLLFYPILLGATLWTVAAAILRRRGKGSRR